MKSPESFDANAFNGPKFGTVRIFGEERERMKREKNLTDEQIDQIERDANDQLKTANQTGNQEKSQAA